MRLFIIIVIVCGFIFSCAHVPQDIPQLYTAYNIWAYRNLDDMRCINYKSSNHFIKAGTPVSDLKIIKVRNTDKIFFKTEGNEFTISFYPRYHPGKTVRDYKKMMFTTKTFNQLSQGMSKNEISAIKRGVLEEGMSKRAVLVSYGYPPEHKTFSLEDNIWIYWMNKFKSKKICFNDNEKTIRCNKMKRKRRNKTL